MNFSEIHCSMRLSTTIGVVAPIFSGCFSRIAHHALAGLEPVPDSCCLESLEQSGVLNIVRGKIRARVSQASDNGALTHDTNDFFLFV